MSYSKKHIITVFLVLLFLYSNAQDRYKPSQTEINTLPQWAQLMYGNNPNINQVDILYRDFYKTNSFEKNYHTQYYKKWRRQIGDRIDVDGYELKISLREKTDRINNVQNNHYRSGNWSVMGPFVSRNTNGDTVSQQSNVYSVDQSLINPLIWYCGTETGEIYSSVDGGNSWTNISLNQIFDGGVTAIEIDPTDINTVYAGSGDFIFKTTDGGTTWNIVLANNNLNANEILVLPGTKDTVLVAGNSGLYRSEDGGDNWTTISTNRSYDIKANVLNSDTLYLVKHNPSQDLCEFFISHDAGITFTLQTNGWHTSTDPGRNDGGARLAVTAADPNRIYAYLIGESKTGDTGFIGVYRSDDGGTSWTLPNGPAGGPYTATHTNLAIGTVNWQYHQGFYNCALAASQTNPDHILVGGLNLYQSNDAGLTFTPLAGYIGGSYNIHVDMQDFRTVGNSTIISTDGGIYHSNDFFATNNFHVRMNGIHASEYWGFGQGWNTDVMVGGLYHNGNLAFHENYGPGNFLQLGGGEPASGYVNPGENRKVYSSDINGRILPLSIGDPVPSIGFGINPNESYWLAESTELEFYPECYNIAITGYQNDLWKTTDGCNSFIQWKEFGTNDDDKITYIEISRSNPDVIYVCQQQSNPSLGKLWKTSDGGNTWGQITLPSISGNSRKILIQLDPSNEDNIWIAFRNGANNNKVYKSNNGGNSWTNLTTTDLDDVKINSLVFIPNTGGDLYAFTNNGVWYRNSASSFFNWTSFSSGLPIEITTNIAKPFYRDGKIRLASYGRGIWESPMFREPTAPIAQIGVDKKTITQHCTADTFHFVDQSIVNHLGASWLWEFNGGSPATDTTLYPDVTYPGPGVYSVKLTVTDSSGNQSIDSINVNVNNYIAPVFIEEPFEMNFPPSLFELVNPDNGLCWEKTTDAGGYGLSTSAAWFNNYDYYPGGEEDDLRISLEFQNPTDSWLSFDVAYARYAVNYSDSLEVLISTDCGQTTNSVYFKGGSDLATSADINQPFIPNSTEWRTDSIDLSSYVGNNEIMIIFRNHSGWGNNTFLDNINISEQTITPNSSTENDLILYTYPNPNKSEGILNFSSSTPINFRLYDLNGKNILDFKNKQDAIQLPSLAAGTYPYIISNSKIWKRGKLIIR
ncbi:MAG: YCF48-related protein [Saprospiraceae bacterium]|nr:YCF48-related protein [Saprospiraceae bacterium]